jgi:hypothetical protein
MLREQRRTVGLTILTIGAVAGLNATVWTLVIPVLAIVTLVAAYREDAPQPA